MLLTTCPPQKCLSVPSARLLGRICCLGRCESSSPPAQSGPEGLSWEQSCSCPWDCFWDVGNENWASEGCSAWVGWALSAFALGSPTWTHISLITSISLIFLQYFFNYIPLPGESPSPALLLTATGFFSAFRSARRHQLLCISGVWVLPAPSAQRAAEQLQKWGFGALFKKIEIWGSL